MALRVTLQNGSSTDTAIVFGTSIGNGRIYAADALVLDVRHGQDGPIEKYRPGGGAPAIAGRIDPWIVPLPSGSEFSLTIPITSLLSPKGDSLSLGGGDVYVRANLIRHWNDQFNGEMVGPGLVKIFVGELQSEWLLVPNDCQVG